MTFKPLEESAAELSEWASGDSPRIRLGFPVIDDKTQGGPAPGELVMVLARSGVGKTSIGCNIARNVRGTPTVFFSLEMASRMLLLRMASIHTNTPTYVVEQQLRYQGRSRPVEGTVESFPFLSICDTPALSIKGMGNYLDEAEEVWGQPTKLVIIDYLELVRAPLGTEGGVATVDSVSRKLKDFARERDCVVVVLHQLSMGASKSKKTPGAKGNETDHGHLPVGRLDAKFGGDVAADYTLGVYRPSLDPALEYTERQALADVIKVQFLKSRGGSELDFWGEAYHYDTDSLRITTSSGQPPAVLL
jgi:replicative DNA helicase